MMKRVHLVGVAGGLALAAAGMGPVPSPAPVRAAPGQLCTVAGIDPPVMRVRSVETQTVAGERILIVQSDLSVATNRQVAGSFWVYANGRQGHNVAAQRTPTGYRGSGETLARAGTALNACFRLACGRQQCGPTVTPIDSRDPEFRRRMRAQF